MFRVLQHKISLNIIMKHNYILIFGILFSLIYIHFVKNYKTNETFIDYSEDDKNTIFIIETITMVLLV